MPVVAEGLIQTFDGGETVEFPLPFAQMEWRGQLEQGGPEITIAGESLEHIDYLAQKEHDGLSIFNMSDNAAAEALAVRSRLTRRNPSCHDGFGIADTGDINSGINHLRSVSRCRVRARHCVRTTCNNRSAIVLCNDRYSDLDIPCNTVADMAASIRQSCWQFEFCPINCNRPGCAPHNCPKSKVSGQQFSGDRGFNVILSLCSRFSSGGQPV
ncbi:hypothetical protein Micbo1qcDRAFT_209014 [Microdochium bolleyi]|uniref:Uncharacterized protein n=1 Tax=Microdochium bolleyi TaxID=196109 RepID=A0A136INU3_9PEZI|nr:hypothetical protein Micbo1qcDRAFT_209014 [Microdochium bolleyi]